MFGRGGRGRDCSIFVNESNRGGELITNIIILWTVY